MQENKIRFHKPVVAVNDVLTIAFVNPPHADWSLINTLTYHLCHSHYNRLGKYKKLVRWLPSPYKWNKYSSCDEIYEEIKEADIIMFSSYVWNYSICDDIAKIAKENNKITLLGGPHIGTNDSEFLKSRNFYDFICRPTKPGEVFLEDCIDSWFENNRNIRADDISWELNSSKTRDYSIADLTYSVYEDHFDYLKEIVDYAKNNKLEPFVVLETTRGCPYSCVFCEWGGGIGTKIQKKPLGIVKRDILALLNIGYRDAMSADANFGIFLERDLEILKFAWENGFSISDMSSMKSKDLSKRKKLVDEWFNIVSKPISRTNDDPNDMWENTKYISVLPTVSIQSISDEAMKIAKRVDLSYKDKLELSRYIGEKIQSAGYLVPALELILAMPGSTLDDFYKEMEIIWNFKIWGLRRHDYMFLPDSELNSEEYKKQYNIETVEVYSDSADEDGSDNFYSLYKNKKSYFKTIRSCYSFTKEELLEMFFMNGAASYLLKNVYQEYENYLLPGDFCKLCYKIIKTFDSYETIHNAIDDIFDPTTPTKSIKKIENRDRVEVIEELINDNILLLKNGLANHVLIN
jgi:radical SAM superfamily enzyme YgiQ (UPF0313 family)